MWILQNVKTKEFICEGFSSQAKLAQFMEMNPRTLCKAFKEGRNTFKFRGEQVCVLQEEVPRFSVQESSDDPPLKFFEKETQVAEWLGLSRQTIYAAFKLNQTEKTFKKDGKEWIVKRISAESPQESKIATPEKEIPSPPKPIPAPRRKTLPPPIPAPRSRKVLPEKESPTKFPNQVKSGKFAKRIDWISPEFFPEKEKKKKEENENIDEILPAELALQFQKFQEEIARLSSQVETLKKEKVELSLEKELKSVPAEVSPKLLAKPETLAEDSPKYPSREKPIFQSKTALQRSNFNAKSMAHFIKAGIVGEISFLKPKTDKYVLVDGKREYLPDLVEEIIATHIHPEMGEGNEEKMNEFSARMHPGGDYGVGLKGADWKAYLNSGMMMGRIRRLDPETLEDIAKELMKQI